MFERDLTKNGYEKIKKSKFLKIYASRCSYGQGFTNSTYIGKYRSKWSILYSTEEDNQRRKWSHNGILEFETLEELLKYDFDFIFEESELKHLTGRELKIYMEQRPINEEKEEID